VSNATQPRQNQTILISLLLVHTTFKRLRASIFPVKRTEQKGQGGTLMLEDNEGQGGAYPASKIGLSLAEV